LLVCATSLGIYHQHRFFFPHWLAVATIILAGLAYVFAHFQRPRRIWLRGHIVCIVLTYYLLIGGGVNEVFLRVDALGGFRSRSIGMTHIVLIVLTLIVLVWYLVKFRGQRPPQRGPERSIPDAVQPPPIKPRSIPSV
jgi:hypothetical protein